MSLAVTAVVVAVDEEERPKLLIFSSHSSSDSNPLPSIPDFFS
jgi:hypothetical protein